jgi:hypothetical protein
MAIEAFWTVSWADYQKRLKVIDQPGQPTLAFPLVITAKKAADKDTVIDETSRLAAQPADKNEPSTLRKLLDANGGAIHIKGLPLRTPQDFSDFLIAMAGKGQNAWNPHTHVGSEVLRMALAEHVMTANE